MTVALMDELVKDSESLKAVYRIQLNLRQQESFELRWPSVNPSMLKDWIEELPAVKTLELFASQLKYLKSPIFQNLKNLEILELSFNNLCYRNLASNTFSMHKNLKRLTLDHNEISSLDENLFQGLASLRHLDISYNCIKALPDGIFKGLVSLKHLDISGNELTIKKDAEVFEGLTNLEYLDLNGNRICSIPEGLFKDLVNLEDLDLAHNEINFVHENGNSMYVFHGLTSLISLNLSYNCLTTLPEGFFNDLIGLKSLNCSGNEMMNTFPVLNDDVHIYR